MVRIMDMGSLGFEPEEIPEYRKEVRLSQQTVAGVRAVEFPPGLASADIDAFLDKMYAWQTC